MKRRRLRLLDEPRPLPVVRWVELDFTVPVRFGDRRTRSAWARNRRSERQTRIQTKITTGITVPQKTSITVDSVTVGGASSA